MTLPIQPPDDYYNRPPKELASYYNNVVDDGDEVLPPSKPCGVICGNGSPEGVVVSGISGIYRQFDAATSSHPIWVKISGSGNTGWRQWAGLRGGSGTNTALRIGDAALASGAGAIAIGEAANARAANDIVIGPSSDTGQVLAHPNVVIGQTALIGTATDSSSPTASTRGGHVVIGEAALADMGPSAFANVVIGREAKSRGRAVITIGHGCEARAANTPVSGQVEGRFAVLMGYLTKGSGGCIVAVGDQSDVRGDNTCAVGSHARANDNNCTALGTFAFAGSTTTDGTGTFATALGPSATAKGQNSIALGGGSVNALEAVGIGRGFSINALHHHAICMGADSVSRGPRGLMIGSVDQPVHAVYFNGALKPAILVNYDGTISLLDHQTTAVDQPIAGNITLTPSEPVALMNTTAASRTVTMPPATGSGVFYYVRKEQAANSVTINPDGADTIDGGASYTLSGQFEEVWLEDVGGDWEIFTI